MIDYIIFFNSIFNVVSDMILSLSDYEQSTETTAILKLLSAKLWLCLERPHYSQKKSKVILYNGISVENWT
jgi:hypothetical protein